jgi:hypothetical protein
MLDVMTKDEQYRRIMTNHCKDIINYLLAKDQHFAILSFVKFTKFEPELPEDIYANFNDITLFVLSGYTFRSTKIDGENLIFEAGFGPDNFGSIVTIPIFSIMQLIVEENVIFINPTANVPMSDKNGSSEARKNSIQSLLNNPKNKKFTKK